MNSPSDQSSPDQPDLEQALADVERSLEQLKSRYAQVKHDLESKSDVQTQLSQAKANYRQHRTPVLHQEIRQLQQRLEELEVALESQLISWGWVRETFWQVVRFGGLGVVLGWLLHAWAK